MVLIRCNHTHLEHNSHHLDYNLHHLDHNSHHLDHNSHLSFYISKHQTWSKSSKTLWSYTMILRAEWAKIRSLMSILRHVPIYRLAVKIYNILIEPKKWLLCMKIEVSWPILMPKFLIQIIGYNYNYIKWCVIHVFRLWQTVDLDLKSKFTRLDLLKANTRRLSFTVLILIRCLWSWVLTLNSLNKEIKQFWQQHFLSPQLLKIRCLGNFWAWGNL